MEIKKTQKRGAHECTHQCADRFFDTLGNPRQRRRKSHPPSRVCVSQCTALRTQFRQTRPSCPFLVWQSLENPGEIACYRRTPWWFTPRKRVLRIGCFCLHFFRRAPRRAVLVSARHVACCECALRKEKDELRITGASNVVYASLSIHILYRVWKYGRNTDIHARSTAPGGLYAGFAY